MIKKIFAINISAPILRDVLLNLKKRNVEVVYWTGYKRDFENDFSKDTENFPNTIFHNNFDTIRGLPAVGTDKHSLPQIPQKIIDALVPYEYLFLDMMERNNINKLSLNELKRLYLNILSYWYGIIMKLKPDAILFVPIPHSSPNYIIYELAKILGVKTIIVYPLKITTRLMVCDDFKSHKNLLRAYEDVRTKQISYDDLSHDVQLYYDKLAGIKGDPTPFYMKEKYMKKRSRQTFVFPRIDTVMQHIKRGTFIITFVRYIELLFFSKARILSLDTDGYHLGISVKYKQYKWARMKKSFAEEYKTLQRKPDYAKPYIYVTLHNQPECNTNPMGGVFNNQIYMVELISKFLPSGWEIYVKESPLQWKWPAGHIGRYNGYYAKLNAIPNVRLVPTDTSTYTLIEHSRAVATVTGTVGWEALFRGKPALVFGYTWYMYCDGVFRIRGSDDCASAFDKIVRGFVPDKRAAIPFLAALDAVTIRGYLDKRFKVKGIDIGHDEAVKNMANGIYNELQCA